MMTNKRLLLLFLPILICVQAQAYQPPIGIPNPKDFFGNFDPIDTPRPDPRAYAPGWFETTPRPNAKAHGDANDCYYIDNTHPNATDTANPYGNPGKPRATIPNLTFTAGAYVEIHGDGGTGSYKYSASFRPAGVGTNDTPIWFVGVKNPILTNTCDIGFANQPLVAFLVFDGIRWASGGRLDLRPRYDNNLVRNIVFRNCSFRGTESTADTSGVFVGASGLDSSTRKVRDIVLHNCEISHYGDKKNPQEECGLYPGTYLTNLWFLDGRIHNMAEDGCGGSHGGKRTSTGYYIGRSTIYNNLTNGIDIKGMGIVVISECEIYGHWANAPGNTGAGENIVVHYSGDSTPGTTADTWKNWPEDVSLLFSRLHDADFGIVLSTVDRFRAVGNVFFDLKHSIDPWNADSAYSAGTAIQMRGIRNQIYISHNTITSCEKGIQWTDSASNYNATATYFRGSTIYDPATRQLYTMRGDDNWPTGIKGVAPTNTAHWKPFRVQIWGNIISNRTAPAGRDIYIASSTLGDNVMDIDYNLIYANTGTSFSYGSTTVRDHTWLKLNTLHQANGIVSDPGLSASTDGHFTPRANGPAIGSATEGTKTSAYTDFAMIVGLDIRRDLTGKLRPEAGTWDVGAIQRQSAPAASPLNAPTGLKVSNE